MMPAFIISIGDELTKGEIVNSNAAYIANEVSKRGINVSSILTLPDTFEIAIQYVNRFLTDEGIFIFTGGLGATQDDITRKIVSRVLKKNLCINRVKTEVLRKWYTTKGRKFTEADMMQASYPEGGRLLENGVGLAYGFYVKYGNQYIFSLPGVPKEMKYMFDNEVIPQLEKQFLNTQHYNHEILFFSDIAEYTLDHRLNEIISKYDGIQYGTRSSYGLIRVRVDSGEKDIEPCVCELIASLGDFFISRGEQNLENIIGDLLIKHNLTLSVAESCTAGLLSKVITDVPGSSRYYVGGIVAYSNDVKKNILKVSDKTLENFGAVSSQTAREMAEGAQKKLQSDITLSVTGIAGPDGGTEKKPVGTVFICLYKNGKTVKDHLQSRWLLPGLFEALKAKPKNTTTGKAGGFETAVKVERNIFSGDRESVRLRSVNKALFILYKFLREMK